MKCSRWKMENSGQNFQNSENSGSEFFPAPENSGSGSFGALNFLGPGVSGPRFPEHFFWGVQEIGEFGSKIFKMKIFGSKMGHFGLKNGQKWLFLGPFGQVRSGHGVKARLFGVFGAIFRHDIGVML